MLCGCGASTFGPTQRATYLTPPSLLATRNAVLSWPNLSTTDALVGARIFMDGPRVSYPEIAITRAALRTNEQLTPMGALRLATRVATAARANDLPPEFLAATLLQESAFDPYAISAAGAVGIAQFEPETADEVGVDPLDPFAAIDAAAALLARYRRAYASTPNPFARALAAYNAGPGAVAKYHGVPPYPETREYIDLITLRWERIASYEKRSGWL